MKISISEAAKELGVAQETLPRWEANGKIEVERTPNGHRRYDLAKLRGLIPRKTKSKSLTLCYSRVSSHDQKDNLLRQVALIEKLKGAANELSA